MLLELRDITRSFAGVPALKQASLEVRAGEVHALVGENGAGKSTMMKIIGGALQPDEGAMLWEGAPATFDSPRAAASHGIGLAHQEPLLAGYLTVAENLFLGHEPMRGFRLDHAALEKRARALLDEFALPLDAKRRAGQLTAAERSLLELARARVTGTRLMILDEPTSSLSEKETELVLRAVLQLKQQGTGVIYISHRIDEVRRVADRVTILRDGRVVHSCALSEIDTRQIIRHMAGRDVSQERRAPAANTTARREMLRVEALTRAGHFSNASFTIHAGEIVGLAGLMGAGRTELCEALFGIRAADSGAIAVDGRPVAIGSPQDAKRAGLAFLTEDRQRTGLLQGRTMRENITAAALPAFSPRAVMNKPAERAVAMDMKQRLRIAGGVEQRVETLSGGNQQKALLARWMLTRARVYLFDEPTRGIDVGAKSEVFELMRELARDGAAVLMVSSEIPELLQVADRLLIMRHGEIVKEVDPAQATREEVLHWAL